MAAMKICATLWGAFWVMWVIWALGIKKAQRREGAATHIAHGALATAGFLLMFLNFHIAWLNMRVLPRAAWLEAAGISMTLAGFAFASWARIHLGRNWSSAVTSRVGHELVRSGPYRSVRHPIYTGLLFALFGTALARGQVGGFIALALVYAAWKIKSGVEERMMTSTFGAEYTAYVSATGAMFPKR